MHSSKSLELFFLSFLSSIFGLDIVLDSLGSFPENVEITSEVSLSLKTLDKAQEFSGDIDRSLFIVEVNFCDTAILIILVFLDDEVEMFEDWLPFFTIVIVVFGLNLGVNIGESLDLVSINLDRLNRMKLKFQKLDIGVIDVV